MKLLEVVPIVFDFAHKSCQVAGILHFDSKIEIEGSLFYTE